MKYCLILSLLIPSFCLGQDSFPEPAYFYNSAILEYINSDLDDNCTYEFDQNLLQKGICINSKTLDISITHELINAYLEEEIQQDKLTAYPKTYQQSLEKGFLLPFPVKVVSFRGHESNDLLRKLQHPIYFSFSDIIQVENDYYLALQAISLYQQEALTEERYLFIIKRFEASGLLYLAEVFDYGRSTEIGSNGKRNIFPSRFKIYKGCQ